MSVNTTDRHAGSFRYYCTFIVFWTQYQCTHIHKYKYTRNIRSAFALLHVCNSSVAATCWNAGCQWCSQSFVWQWFHVAYTDMHNLIHIYMYIYIVYLLFTFRLSQFNLTLLFQLLLLLLCGTCQSSFVRRYSLATDALLLLFAIRHGILVVSLWSITAKSLLRVVL